MEDYIEEIKIIEKTDKEKENELIIKTKSNNQRQQRKGDYTVLDYDDYLVRNLRNEINCEVYYFSLVSKVTELYINVVNGS